MSDPEGIGDQIVKKTTVQIDGMMSIFDVAGVEKQIKRRDGVVRVDANFLNGTATIVHDETRVALDDINRFILSGDHLRQKFLSTLAQIIAERGRSGLMEEPSKK